MKRIRRIAACFLLLALPLQGIAAHAPVMSCDGGNDATAQQAHDMHGNHAAASGHDLLAAEPHPGGHDAGGKASGHNCCHHAFTGLPPAAHAGMPETPREIPGSVQLLTTLFIPELPQRPPRA
jgi:hypothetical protein